MYLLRDTTEPANESDSDHADGPGMQNVMVLYCTVLSCHLQPRQQTTVSIPASSFPEGTNWFCAGKGRKGGKCGEAEAKSESFPLY
jgi:hypothetical protein